MKKSINTALALAFGLALSVQAASYVTDNMVVEMAAQGRIPVIAGLDSIQADTVVSAAMFADTAFADTLQGLTTNVVVTVQCSRDRTWVRCSVPGGSGTSNSTALTLQAFGANWRPAIATPVGGLSVTDAGVTRRTGSASMGTNGVLTFSKADTTGIPSATFTNSATAKGYGTFVIEFKK